MSRRRCPAFFGLLLRSTLAVEIPSEDHLGFRYKLLKLEETLALFDLS